MPGLENCREMLKLAVISLGIAVFIAAGATAASAAPKGARWGANYFPNYKVQSQDGTVYRFYEDLIENKVVIINFIYTSCTDICGLQTARMAKVQDKLGDRLGKDVFIYSISLDPERDTPEALKKYSKAFGTRPGWMFLTGKPAELHLIRYKLGERSRSLAEHRNGIVLGNDRTGLWGRSSMMQNISTLVLEIEELDPSLARVRSDEPQGSSTGYTIPKQPGQAMFLKMCAACHTIGMGRGIGPDLEGLSSRRKHDWIVDYMVSPDRVRHRKDPIAMALSKQFPGALMPDLSLARTDAEDLINYIDAQTARLARPSEDAPRKVEHNKHHDHHAHAHGHKKHH